MSTAANCICCTLFWDNIYLTQGAFSLSYLVSTFRLCNFIAAKFAGVKPPPDQTEPCVSSFTVWNWTFRVRLLSVKKWSKSNSALNKMSIIYKKTCELMPCFHYVEPARLDSGTRYYSWSPFPLQNTTDFKVPGRHSSAASYFCVICSELLINWARCMLFCQAHAEFLRWPLKTESLQPTMV